MYSISLNYGDRELADVSNALATTYHASSSKGVIKRQLRHMSIQRKAIDHYSTNLQSLAYNEQLMDVAEATLELHSNKNAQMDNKREESKGIRAIHVSNERDSQASDTDDEGNDVHGEFKNDEYHSVLCKAFSQMAIDEMEPSSAGQPGSNALPDVECEQNIDPDCSLLQNDPDSEDDRAHSSKSDSSSDSSDTLDLSSDNEGEPNQNFSTDRGGGDADVNLNSDPSHQIIKVNIAPKQRQHDPEAYKKWLKAKNEEIRKNREKEMFTKLELQRQKELEEEKRKEMNKKKIQEWMERKKQNCKKSNPNPEDYKSLDSTSEHLHCDPDAMYKNWLLKVRKRDEEKRLRDLTVKQLEQQIQEQKKEISKEIYQQWLKNAKHKPRPVPLNQGPNTLRGTVSKIFVNPEPWKSNCD